MRDQRYPCRMRSIGFLAASLLLLILPRPTLAQSTGATQQSGESVTNLPSLSDAFNAALTDGNDLTPLLTLQTHRPEYT